MSDEQIIGTLENIKANCLHQNNCETCQFKKSGIFRCQIQELVDELGGAPRYWCLDRIKEVLKK